ncbi:MAG: hypothetical protein RMJ57_02990 [Bacteroidia bacterium]|nr:hypothetical protein [Bacteroidia bacterium]
MEKPHPSFRPAKRTEEISEGEFEQIKKEYNYRCATCGSEEGKENLRYPAQITQLQKAHRNPHKPVGISYLSASFVIEQTEINGYMTNKDG